MEKLRQDAQNFTGARLSHLTDIHKNVIVKFKNRETKNLTHENYTRLRSAIDKIAQQIMGK